MVWIASSSGRTTRIDPGLGKREDHERKRNLVGFFWFNKHPLRCIEHILWIVHVIPKPKRRNTKGWFYHVGRERGSEVMEREFLGKSLRERATAPIPSHVGLHSIPIPKRVQVKTASMNVFPICPIQDQVSSPTLYNRLYTC